MRTARYLRGSRLHEILRRLTGPASPPPSAGNRVATVCERLEDRTLFSFTLTTFTDQNSGAGGLRIIGGSSSETLTVNDDPSANTVSVSGSGISGTQMFMGVELFDIRTNGGNDKVAFTVVSEYNNSNRSIFIDLGTGNDELDFTTPDVDILNQSTILLDFIGGTGNDDISFEGDGVKENSRLNLQIDADDGNDDVDTLMEDVETGAQYDVIVRLSTGKNLLENTIFNVDKGCTANYNLKGGDSTGSLFDDVKMNVGGDIGGTLIVNAYLGAGNDKMATRVVPLVDEPPVILTPLQIPVDGTLQSIAGTVRVNLNGQAGDDYLEFETNENAPTEVFGVLDVALVGGAGNDFTDVDLGSDDGRTGGLVLTGTFKLRQQGQTGNDKSETTLKFVNLLMMDAVGTSSIMLGGRVDVIVTGDSGNDLAKEFMLFDSTGLGGLTYVGGFALLDGGADIDTRGLIKADNLTNLKVQRFDLGPNPIMTL